METNLEEFLADHIIVIPAMQRDYAQGRDNTEARNIRKLFISSILDAIFGDTALTLDFTYGDSRNNDIRRYYPIDGQQRLTTLFLVYAYVFKKAVCEKDKNTANKLNVLRNFHFEARDKAEQYIKELLSVESDFAKLTIPELWHDSPTAEGLARTYSMIMTMFKDKGTEKKQSLTASDCLERLSKITFMELHSNLPDNVFCTMNARGRALTEFEIFKSGIVKKFKDDRFVKAANSFYEKLFDSECNENDDIDKNVTDTIMYVIRSWFSFLEVPKENTAKKISCEKDLYIAFDDYFESIKNAGIEESYAIKTLTAFFDFFSKEDVSYKALTDILPSRKKASLAPEGKIPSEILASCVAFFGIDERTHQDNLEGWMRFACNILDNTTPSIERVKLLTELGRKKEDIAKALKDYKFDELKSKASNLFDQFEEEVQKAGANDEQTTLLIKAENFSFANGAVRFLFRNETGKVDWVSFKDKTDKFFDVFKVGAEDKELINFPSELFERFVMESEIGELHECFLFDTKVSTDLHWRKVFLDRAYSDFTHRYFINDERNDKTDFISIRKHLIELGKMVAADKRKDERMMRYRWYYGYPCVYPRNKSGNEWYMLDGAAKQIKSADNSIYWLGVNNELFCSMLKQCKKMIPCYVHWNHEKKGWLYRDVEIPDLENSDFVLRYSVPREGEYNRYRGDNLYFRYSGCDKIFSLNIDYKEYKTFISEVPIKNGCIDYSCKWEPVIEINVRVSTLNDEKSIKTAIQQEAVNLISRLDEYVVESK